MKSNPSVPHHSAARRCTLRPLALLALALCSTPPLLHAADNTPAPNPTPPLPAALSRPLALADALDLALQQNGAILKAKADLEAAYGIEVQTRAVALPKVQVNGQYSATDAIDEFDFGGNLLTFQQEQNWNVGIRLVQSIFEGGRVSASWRSARLTRDQALLQYQAVINDTLLEVRIVYADVLLAAQLITVQEASVELLQKELDDVTRRFEAGTVPRFNVLRAEVELANARPRLIRARNAYRITKSNLVRQLGFTLPPEVWEDIPLQLSGTLSADPYAVELSAALRQAQERRPEIAALRKADRLRQEAVTIARADYFPSVQVFAGYGSRNSTFVEDLSVEVHGWNAGAQFNWNLWDGNLTRGRVREARARYDRTQAELTDLFRTVELEVRTAYSNFIEAREVLESQRKVQEQAEEALRLANSRAEAGTGTQLDVLSAQTALTEARSTQVQALRDYDVARARLERAIGQPIATEQARK